MAVPSAGASGPVAAPTGMAPHAQARGPLRWVLRQLPHGHGLPQAEWHSRHRAIVAFVLAHAVALAIFGLVRKWDPVYALGEGASIAALGGLAMVPQLSRKMRGAVAAFGCVVASSVLVQFSGGTIEAHFHFFVVVALISLYQDWAPFLVAVGFVAVDHGLLGTLLPTWVYNHEAALANPWKWAVIHAVLVLAECVALIAVWRANEDARAETDRVLRSAGEALIGVDAECRVTFANPAAVRMAGGSDQHILGQPLYMMLLGADGRPLFAGPEILRENPGAFSLTAWLAGRDGRRTPVEVLCNPVEGRTHQEGAVIAMRDITERLRAEQERTDAQRQSQELEQLREVNSFKTRFMNMAAHELNTPLTPIRVQMHLLKNHAQEPPLEVHRGAIQMLDRNFGRLASLVQELLDSTRLQSNRLAVAPRPIDLAPMLAELRQTFEPLARTSGLHFEVQSDPALRCHADEQRVVQAVSNLVVNAVKFTPSGGRVRILGRQEPDGVRIEVRDDGIGLTGDQIGRLFQPFEQVHESQVASHQGSGLGLYITRGIVEMHGGRIWVESEGPGKGSAFILTLPQRAVSVQARSAMPASSAAAPAPAHRTSA